MSKKFNRRRVLQAIGVSTLGSSIVSGAAVAQPDSPEPNSENTIAFNDLSQEAQAIFRRGLQQDRYSSRDPLPDGLNDYLFVKYDDSIYRINREYRDIRKNRIKPRPAKDPEVVEDPVGILDFKGLAPPGQQIFKQAVQSGEHTSTAEWIFTFEDDYVKYNDQYFTLNFVHLDIPEYSIAPSLYKG